MELNLLKSNTPRKKSQRIGRGGKRGTTSGRGTKGQKSRSGHKIRPAERDLIIRTPKLRGYKNKSIQKKLPVLNVDQLENLAKDGKINKEILGYFAKILGNGEIKAKITVEGLSVSKSAIKKIEKAGGSVSDKSVKESTAKKSVKAKTKKVSAPKAKKEAVK